jgi:6-phosphogluconolactonase
METPLSRTVHIFPDLEALSHRAASMFVKAAADALAEKGKFSAAISGGSTPLGLFSLLGTKYADKIDWQSVHIFWADERCVRKENDKSNFKHADDLWLSKVPLPAENIHSVKGELDPLESALWYEHDIRDAFDYARLPAFDLILLGMGDDGHTASLFPAAESLAESRRIAMPVYVEMLRSWRITLTLPVLNNARQIMFLVSGKSKAPVLADILDVPVKKSSYPAGLVKGHISWLVDKDAASKLKDTSGKEP